MKTALTIAGADPSGGAGIQSDLKTFSDFKVRGLSAIAALTAQNRRTVRAVAAVEPGFLKAQVLTLLEEFDADAVKIGMLGSPENAVEAARLLGRHGPLRGIKTVLDPVLRSTGGRPLIGDGGPGALGAIKRLLPLVTLVTPNIPEAEALSGLRVKDAEGMEEAARVIFKMGCCVLVKGGHLESAPVDVLYDGEKITLFGAERIKGGKERFHGTGCMLSAAIAAGLAKKKTLKGAVRDARGYMNAALLKRA